MQKIYAYVDESGQEIEGKVFIVAVVVLENNRDEMMALCEKIERETKKGKIKWRKTRYPVRIDFIKRVIENKKFHTVLRLSLFREYIHRDEGTIFAIAQALKWHLPSNSYTTLVYIDALTKTKRHQYASAIRKFGVSNDAVHGITKEENNALIRLADTLAGWAHDVSDGQIEMTKLYNKAKERGIVIEV